MKINVKSLQLELYLWIIASTLLVLLIGGSISGAIAFFQARELQDNTLKEIALLVRNSQLTPATTTGTLLSELAQYNQVNNSEQEDETNVILIEIKNDTFASTPNTDFLTQTRGLQTIDFYDEQWRVLVVKQKQSDRKFLIAQPTELRDEIAIASAMSTLYPLLIFVAGLLLLIHLVLKKQFKSIKQLTQSLDQQEGNHLTQLSQAKVPSEIQPFVLSINSLMQRVQSTLEKQQRFIADAAHELRTPIAALSLQAENLKNAGNTQEHEQRLTSLQQGFLRLGNLVGQLLDLARLQANSEHTSKLNHTQTVKLNEVVKQVIQDCYPLAENGNIDLGVIRQDENLLVTDTNGLLSQLVQNAIANAIHYTPENGEVNISLFKENNRAVLLVEDTGCGIPEEELEKVMEPFYRVQANKNDGNGLGLTISQEIADKLGGRIILANRDGGGLVYRYEQVIK